VTGFTYRYAFPIEDDELTTLQVRRQAMLVFPDVAAERGIRIIGDITVTLDGERVICESDAQPIPGRRVPALDRYGLRVAELAAAGLNDPQIAHELGDVSSSTVHQIRRALNIPAADPRGGSGRRIGREAA
jgi:hypothetical protein